MQYLALFTMKLRFAPTAPPVHHIQQRSDDESDSATDCYELEKSRRGAETLKPSEDAIFGDIAHSGLNISCEAVYIFRLS